MGNRLAILITYLFHPLLIPTYGICLLYRIFSNFYFIHDNRILISLVGITFVSTCLLPAISALFLFRSGLLSNLEMTDRRERLLPYLLTTLYYLLAYYLLKNFPLPSGMLLAVRLFTLGATCALLLTSGINLIWKISAHAIAIGGLTGAFLILCLKLSFPPIDELCWCTLVAGMVGWARLKLEAHSPAQIYAGFGLGMLAMVGLFFGA